MTTVIAIRAPVSGAKALAAALARAGRGNDTMLAHISPREARMLKRAGGSGRVNPNTGIIEFDDSGMDFSNQDFTSGANYSLAPSDTSVGLSPTPGTGATDMYSLAPAQTSLGLTTGGGTGFDPTQNTTFWNTLPTTGGTDASVFTPTGGAGSMPAPSAPSGNAVSGLSFTPTPTGNAANGLSFAPAASGGLGLSTNPGASNLGLSLAPQASSMLPAATNPALSSTPFNPANSPTMINGSGLSMSDIGGDATGTAPPGTEPIGGGSQGGNGFLSSLGKGLGSALSNPALLARLLGGGAAAVAAGTLSNHAQQQAAQQAQDYQHQFQQIANPLVSGGMAILNAGRTGQLTPMQEQQLQAERARGMQALARQGITSGTAVQQLDAIIEQQRQQFASNLVTQGLQQLQLGDQYAAQAIQALYNGNTQANQLAAQFAQQIGQILGTTMGAGGSVAGGVNQPNTGTTNGSINVASQSIQ